MAIIGAVFVIAAFAWPPLEDEHANEPDVSSPAPRGKRREPEAVHEHEHAHVHAPSAPPGRVRTAVTAVIIVGATLALLVLPPATLTSAVAAQRSINSETSVIDQGGATLIGADTSTFTVKDWAVLLRQNPDVDAYTGTPVEVSGFVLASTEDSENVFYITRFVVTHCAIDAQPVGVPIYLPGWQEEYDADQWVEASGALAANPAPSGTDPLVLVPEELARIEEPSDPYVF
jgi:uncharacterized repeat protein (TIGR03943 family)